MSLVVAWIALGVSVVSAGAAIWSVRQTWLYHPKPAWVHSFNLWNKGQDGERRPQLVFRLTNHGKSAASDVHFRVSSPRMGWFDVSSAGRSLPPDKAAELGISLVTGDLATVFDSETALNLPAVGEEVPGTYRVRVSWRQSPKPEKLRSRTFEYRVK
jgi:hypothetical protein